MKIVKGGIHAAQGFLSASARAGLKTKGDDIGLIYSKTPAVSDGVFTQNQVQAAPVIISKAHLKQDLMSQAIVVNSGCANCCTGEKGLKDAHRIAELVAKALAIKKEDVLLASTGIIGQPLDMAKIEKAIPQLIKAMSDDGSLRLAKTIMTTDTVPKEYAVRVSIGGKEVSIGGIAKGAGMIHPNMATMLCFLTTDVYITRRALKRALESAVDRSFNAITIDGDMSTNDSVFVMANGAAANRLLDKNDPDYRVFTEALEHVTRELAKMLVRDGEGATKFVEIIIKNCPSYWQGVKIGKKVASSNLLKTAIYGCDPNWGRIVASLGASGVRLHGNKFDVYLGKKLVVKDGAATFVKKDHLAKAFAGKEIAITIDLKQGSDEARVWTCDLTEEYIKINAEYET
ncbi:MAG: bifunctional glutamate N-acetyltransferase/amino-acid acetyltransferase ArgJ [Candidatus Omnitrophota bacterium]